MRKRPPPRAAQEPNGLDFRLAGLAALSVHRSTSAQACRFRAGPPRLPAPCRPRRCAHPSHTSSSPISRSALRSDTRSAPSARRNLTFTCIPILSPLFFQAPARTNTTDPSLHPVSSHITDVPTIDNTRRHSSTFGHLAILTPHITFSDLNNRRSGSIHLSILSTCPSTARA